MNKAISNWVRMIGKKGGIARSKKLTAARRREIAQAAAMKRWGKNKTEQRNED